MKEPRSETISIKPFTTTGIGSVPFLDVDQSLARIGRVCPEAPYWPQFIRLHPREDMILQMVDGLPLLEADEGERRVLYNPEDKERALTEFYENFFARNLDHFAVPDQAGAGLKAMLRRAEDDPDFGPEFLKVQITGPVTFGQSVRTPDERNLLDDPEMADVVVKGLGMKAAWAARRVLDAGRRPILFIDEPGLTGFGSAFSNLSREQVLNMLVETAEIARAEGEMMIGVHVCGNTDWGLLTEAGLDIINFDAFSYLDHFLLYPKEIRAFLQKGGWVAWGVVPTSLFTGNETADELAQKLESGWARLAEGGLDPELIRSRALITPACGLGSLSEDQAFAVLDLLSETASKFQ